MAVGRSVRKSISKSPKYALVVLHTRAGSSTAAGEPHARSAIDYISLVLDILIFGMFAVIGTVYFVGEDENSCTFGVPLYLMIAGYTNVLLSILRFFMPMIGTMLQCAFNLGITIYGSILIFPRFNVWQGENHLGPTYCHPLPFLAAFVLLVVLLIWFGVILIVVTVVLIMGCTGGFKSISPGPPPDQILVISQSELGKLKHRVRRASDRMKGKNRGQYDRRIAERVTRRPEVEGRRGHGGRSPERRDRRRADEHADRHVERYHHHQRGEAPEPEPTGYARRPSPVSTDVSESIPTGWKSSSGDRRHDMYLSDDDVSKSYFSRRSRKARKHRRRQ